ncbi:glycoside hydrolase [Haladaptatus sp. GCM10025707]|uniref:glycoside hydrolase n=1 Tax=unclassified Haladaptatus TaxID=2622732 RepID=UPI0023E8D73F|nr:glycoside hydrolase [Haladaptatus sp. QDMS2]
MAPDISRRQVLLAGAVSGVAGTAWYGTVRHRDTYSTEAEPLSTDKSRERPGNRRNPDPVDVRGAVYIPSRAFNLYQMWDRYDPEVIERDLSYAKRVNLNAVRTWLCYEVWKDDPEGHEEALDHFLAAAADRDISVLLGLFDAIGAEPKPSRLEDTDPRTAIGLSSPSSIVLLNREKWDETRRFVRWFMDRYRDDERLLGIELMNEPGWESIRKSFAEAMFATAADHRGTVPLTVGSTSLGKNAEYAAWGSEILQFHYNFASDRQTFRTMLDRVAVLHDAMDSPIWLTEWQRTRRGRGFTSAPKPSERTPDYASLAPLVHETGFGNFFWSLMVKPAWIQPQRSNGVVNGLFHEDGAVWSLDDARAIQAMSGTSDFEGEERKRLPAWATPPQTEGADE